MRRIVTVEKDCAPLPEGNTSASPLVEEVVVVEEAAVVPTTGAGDGGSGVGTGVGIGTGVVVGAAVGAAVVPVGAGVTTGAGAVVGGTGVGAELVSEVCSLLAAPVPENEAEDSPENGVGAWQLEPEGMHEYSRLPRPWGSPPHLVQGDCVSTSW